MFAFLTVATVTWRVFEAWSTLEFIRDKSGLLWSIPRFLFASEMGANILVVAFVALFVGSLLYQFERKPLSSGDDVELLTSDEVLPQSAVTAEQLLPQWEPEPAPNIVCLRCEVVHCHTDDTHAILIEGYYKPGLYPFGSEYRALVAVLDNKTMPSRKVGPLVHATARLVYKKNGRTIFEVSRGSWLSEGGTEVHFGVGRSHSLVLAITPADDKPNPQFFAVGMEQTGFRGLKVRVSPLRESDITIEVNIEAQGRIAAEKQFVAIVAKQGAIAAKEL